MMDQKYGIKINNAWDIFTIYFENGKQVSGRILYPLPDGANHAPTPAQLLADGRRLVVPTIYDETTHKLVANSYSIIDDETMRQDKISRSDQAIRDIRLAAIKAIADAKIEALVPNGEKNRWETRGLRLAWKAIKHLKSPGTNQDLNPQEESLAEELDLLGETTEAIREARDNIRIDINNASGQALKDIDSTITNPYWPQHKN